MLNSGGGDLKQCYQCATCSVVCELSGDDKPFPRKEMIAAQWGLKDRLVADPDVWLCHQCDDCSTHCPRGAHPGDVMAAIRRESVIQHSVPGFLGRWMNELKYLPVLLAIPVVLLGLLVLAPIQDRPAVTEHARITYACWSELPQWALIIFFTVFSGLAAVAMIAGVIRFWSAMKAADTSGRTPVKGVWPSLTSVLKGIFLHNHFNTCGTDRSRSLSHMCVFYGFLALTAVAVWVVFVVVTAPFNPLLPDGMIYPFSVFDPWRILANVAAVAVIGGCLWMIWERLKKQKEGGSTTYADWYLLGAILLVVVSGLAAEVLHLARLEPHRLFAYFGHLVLVFSLLMYLPYSKLAHVVYRTTAMVYAEHTGRAFGASPTATVPASQTAAPAKAAAEAERPEESKTEQSSDTKEDGDAKQSDAEESNPT